MIKRHAGHALPQLNNLVFVLVCFFALFASNVALAEVPRAYAGIVVDAKTGDTLYSYAADSPRYPASVTKVMTLYMLFAEMKAGRMNLNTRLSVSEHASNAVPTKLYVRPGQTIKVEDAIKALVTLSANDVARVIAENIAGTESAFAQRMTATARALGMNRTTYANASGLPDSRQVTTVRDQARLAMAIFQHFPEYYEYFNTRSFTYGGKTYGNHNRLLGQNGVDGLKTGYIRAAGYNLLTSARANNRHIVVAAFGFSSGGERNAKVAQLVDRYLGKARRGDYWAQAQIPYAGTRGGGSGGANVFAVATTQAPTPAPAPAFLLTPETAVTPLEAVTAQAQQDLAVASIEPVPQDALALLPPTPAAPPVDLLTTTPEQQPLPVAVTTPQPAAIQQTPAQPAPPPLDLMTAAPVTANVAQPQRPLDIIGQWISESFQAPVRDSALPPMPVGVASLPPADVGIDNTPSGSVDAVAPTSTWVVQVGAAPSEDLAENLLQQASTRLQPLQDYRPYVERFENVGQVFYRARFSGFADQQQALAMCNQIRQSDMSCLAIQG